MVQRGGPSPRPIRFIPNQNIPAREALEKLIEVPTTEGIDRLFAACFEGSLVVDITGSQPGSTPRARTIATTTGEQVLPLFTSTDELRTAVPRQQRARVQMLVLPGREAFALIDNADFVAVQIDAGSLAQVITRSFVTRALFGERTA
ncbi:SseB family protein [Rathayibacter toxicus]|uniref:SseB protein N-terminal domain-containing protein n=1 Tax=Rathayibacter toxicus TaxID=145458 RepID=A0A0C5BFD0_9MICO|nr:SseB family protein [Rathayibacter toxicus]AJM76905.1 hypothetical protein TI83_00770 [Rathayibacter toxicus]ALS57323.1 hypothetical protein APU90_05710 [Rathayibacter toxicus]KKM45708.1 hypothetical protein VT73_06000 [Rathayibacter toxicus]PPG24799.1 hypothetical protein C5D15_00575 [Rathayibacter toxicus]PPG48254.1 hypothetical protein C5D16_00590 [Rathayibacter toxicus]